RAERREEASLARVSYHFSLSYLFLFPSLSRSLFAASTFHFLFSSLLPYRRMFVCLLAVKTSSYIEFMCTR
ncbi:hypothetical protein F8388_018006, partial [Cannabis sativa]